MINEGTLSLLRSADEIKVAIDTDGDRIGELLNQQHSLPPVDGEPAFDYRKHMQHLVLQLDTAADEALVAENTYHDQGIRVSRLLNERDESVAVSYDKLVAARQGLGSVYKRGSFELAHVSGNTPRVPDRLSLQLGRTIELLRQPAVQLRGLKIEGFNVDFGAMAGDLESGKKELDAVVERLKQARKVAEGLLLIKGDKVDVLHRTVLYVGRTTEGLFHLAGEPELAARIRSSTRRPLRPSEKEEEPSAEEPSPDTEPEADPEPSTES